MQIFEPAECVHPLRSMAWTSAEASRELLGLRCPRVSSSMLACSSVCTSLSSDTPTPLLGTVVRSFGSTCPQVVPGNVSVCRRPCAGVHVSPGVAPVSSTQESSAAPPDLHVRLSGLSRSQPTSEHPSRLMSTFLALVSCVTLRSALAARILALSTRVSDMVKGLSIRLTGRRLASVCSLSEGIGSDTCA